MKTKIPPIKTKKEITPNQPLMYQEIIKLPKTEEEKKEKIINIKESKNIIKTIKNKNNKK